MSELEIYQFPCRSDNYGVLIHDPDADVTASIDAPDGRAVLDALSQHGWKLSYIFTTHYHGDHTEGNARLKTETGCEIIGPKAEADRIAGLDRAVSEGDTITFGRFSVNVLETPGHTAGHVSYHIPDAKVAFVGDTLFAMGCGRLFEGSPQLMWSSLKKIMAFPPDTMLYCGHEYTQANAKFALSIDPDNTVLQQRAARVDVLRSEGHPTLPTSLVKELQTNPFLRADNADIRARLDMKDAEDWQVFGEIRARKDRA